MGRRDPEGELSRSQPSRAEGASWSEGQRALRALAPGGVAVPETLRDAEELFEALPVACCVIDASGRVVRGNTAFADLVRVSRGDCSGRLLSGWFSAAERPAFEQRQRRVLVSAPCSRHELGQFALAGHGIELRVSAVGLEPGRDGPRWLMTLVEEGAASAPQSQVRLQRRDDRAGFGSAGGNRAGDEHGAGELPDGHAAPSQESIAALASTVAHDFGNLLQGVMGCLNLALSEATTAVRARGYTQQALDALRGSSGFLAELKRLGPGKLDHPGASEPGPRLPAVAAPSGPAPDTRAEPHFSGRALLVEDDWRVRIGIRHYLQQLGFEVVEAGDVGEALSLANGTVALLVTDVILPENTGPSIRRLLIGAHPELKAVFISAHPARYLIDQGLLEAGDVILQKPFDLHQLAYRLAEVCPPAGWVPSNGSPAAYAAGQVG